MLLASASARILSIIEQLSGLLPAPCRVLELGCGDCPVIHEKFIPVHVELDLDSLHLARQSFPSAALIQADIRCLPFSVRFGLVVARHPDVDRHCRDWEHTFRTSGGLLVQHGILLVTAYGLPEIELIAGWLSPLAHIPLDMAQLAPPDLAGRDRFVIACQPQRLYN